LFRRGKSRRWQAIAKTALRKLDMPEAAVELADLRAPAGNRLESLQGDRRGQNSIHLNDQSFVLSLGAGGTRRCHIVDDH
jgi:proteic killer suppression protein